MTPGTEQRKLAAIMFTDMVGYSALAQRNEALALELLGEQQRLLRPLFPKFNGREIKSTGDGFLVEFASALEAAQCAIEIQKAVAAYNATASPERHFHLRIGLHLGDVVVREADMFGDGVNIASRIEPLAEAGGICLSGPVHDQVANKLGVALVKLGAPELKNIQTPVDVYRVVLPWHGGGRTARPGITKLRRPSTARMLLFAGTAGLVLLGVVWLVVQQRGATRSLRGAAGGITSLAVKPLDDLSGETNQAHLSDGMTMFLGAALGNIGALSVRGHSSAMRYKGGQKSIREMAKDLEVDAIVEGSILRASNRIQVIVRLIEAATDRQLWGTNYNRDVGEFFVLQEEVARAIAAEVQVRLTPEDQARLARARTAKPEAVDAYLRGMHLWWQWSDEGLTRALRHFDRAIELEPGYAPAHAGRALAYAFAGGWVALMPAREAAPQCKAAAQKAIQLDPTLLDAHVALGYARLYFDWDWVGAEESFTNALRLNPHSVLALDGYQDFLVLRGRFDEAITVMHEALKQDPLSPALLNDLGWSYWAAGRLDRAIPELDKALELDRSFVTPRRQLAFIYLAKGRTNDAMSEFEAAARLEPDSPGTQADLAYAYGLTGRQTEARQVLAHLESLSRKRYVSPCARLGPYLGLGQKEVALDWLETAYQERDGLLVMIIMEPWLAPLRNEPRFQVLLKKLGLAPASGANPPVTVPQKSVAVLPFMNLSADKADEYLSDSITDELINTLQGVSGLQVPGRASSFYFKGRNESPQRMGEHLRVTYLVGGSASKSGNKLWIKADLVTAADGLSLWSAKFERDLSDFFKVQSEVAQAIASEIQVRLTPEDQARLARARTAKPETIEACLLGMRGIWLASEEGMTNALRHFQRAIEIEPDYAPAHAGLALAHIYGSTFVGLWAPTNGIPKGKAAAQRALQLDPLLADAYVALGYIRLSYDWDWAGAEKDFKRALELSPRSSLAQDGYANFLGLRGRFDEAAAVLKKALELDPYSAGLHHDLGWIYRLAGQCDAAIPEFRQALDLDRGLHGSRILLSACHLQAGKTNEVLAELRTTLQLAPDSAWAQSFLGYAYGLIGRRDDAMRIVADLDQLARRRYVTPGAQAYVYVGLGQAGVALDFLEQSYKERHIDMVFLKVEPVFNSLRNEPRFQELLQKVEDGGRAP